MAQEEAGARAGCGPLDIDHALTEDDVDAAARIVAQMGHEPFMRALDEGAEVVIAGRAYDPAMMGAHALREGFDPAPSSTWARSSSAARAAAYPRHGSDGLLGIVDRDGFTVEPPNPNQVCTVASVAAHSLYEKSDPYLMHFPAGAIDLRATTFEQVTPRAVRVAARASSRPRSTRSSSRARAAWAIARSPSRARAIRCSSRNIDAYLANVRARVAETYPDGYRLLFHVYGRDGVMGAAGAGARRAAATRWGSCSR